MMKINKKILTLLVASAMIISNSTFAHGGHGGGHGGGGGHSHHGGGYGGHGWGGRWGGRWGAPVAAGVATGVATGALIGAAAANNNRANYYYNTPVYPQYNDASAEDIDDEDEN